MMKTRITVNTQQRQTSNVVQEFSRFAHQYEKYNMIQAKVAIELVGGLSSNVYHRVIDIGCGSGSVFKNFKQRDIFVENFIAIDSSIEMLTVHPMRSYVEKVCIDFNEKSFLHNPKIKNVDLCISSSALQWSIDLNFTIKRISEMSNNFHAAIFTSGTFKTLHSIARLNSPIYDIETIKETCTQHFKSLKFKVHHYKLEFPTTREMIKYIKQSGVSGGERQLKYKQMKHLIAHYPLDYLEFEVLFIEGKN